MKRIFLFFIFSLSTLQLTSQVKAIHYQTAETTLSENQKTDLQNWLKKYQSQISSISIEGYADSIGSHPLNIKYSQHRAQHVVQFIRSQINADFKIQSAFYGESKMPFSSSDSNRCVIIKIKLLHSSDSLETVFQVDTTQNFETNTQIQFENGTTIEVPAGAFSPIKIRDIDFKATEVYTLCDMLQNNTTTSSTDGDCLISAGMVYIKAIYQGLEIQPNKGSFLKIKVPVKGQALDTAMWIYKKHIKESGEIKWEKITADVVQSDQNGQYYLFKTDSLFDFNLDKPIKVRCEKKGPLVKVPKSNNLMITQIYLGEKYLSIAERKSNKCYKLDEIDFERHPILIVIYKDQNGSMYIAEGQLNQLKLNKWSNKYKIKKKYFRKLPNDFTASNTVKYYMCRVLNAKQEAATNQASK
jgi:hypothetical protein